MEEEKNMRSRKNILKEAGVLLLATIMITTTFSVTNTDADISLKEGIKTATFDPRDDTTPPVTYCNLTGTLIDGIYVSDVTVKLIAIDNESGVNYTTYKLNDGAWTVYTAPFVVVADGTHILTYYSVDNNGNFEILNWLAFTIRHHWPGLKWEQLPDVSPYGIDICVDRGNNYYAPRMVADDFQCTSTGSITNISLWGSWKQDYIGNITMFHLGIYADIPANQSQTEYSMPGAMLWERNFSQGEFKKSVYYFYANSYWWDPYFYLPIPRIDFKIYQFDFDIPKDQAFNQIGTITNPVTYWLGIYVNSTNGVFGWKTCWPTIHWNDDATYYIPNSPWWNELRYQEYHPYYNESIDMAFRINTSKPKWDGKITIANYDLAFVAVKITSHVPYDDLHWKVMANGGFWYPSNPIYEGTISHIATNETVTVKTGFLLGLGSFNLTIQVEEVAPVETKGFIFLFIIFVKTPSYS